MKSKLKWEVISKDEVTQRCGHNSVVLNNTFYSFSGFEDIKGNFKAIPYLFSYNLINKTWKQHPKSELLDDRYHFSMVSYQDCFYIFGGSFDDDLFHQGYDFYAKNIHEFNTVTQEWKMIEVKGNVPLKRFKHSAVVVGNNMIIYGGNSTIFEDVYNDVWSLNFETWKWKEIKIKKSDNIITSRASHSACSLENSMYVFGGTNNIINKRYNSLYEFKDQKWTQLDRKGDYPTPRAGGTLIGSNDYLYYFGGFDGKKDSNELYVNLSHF